MILPEKIIVFEKSLGNIFNYIFLIYFSLTGVQRDLKNDTFQIQR